MTQTGTQVGPLASREFLQALLDALPQHIAVLDRQGTIIATNAAWRRFGRDNGLDEPAASCLGSSYLEICERARGRYSAGAREAAQGIRAVAAGQRVGFELEYACPSPSEERWFVMRVSRFEDDGRSWVAVAHDNTTERKLAEQAARDAAEQRRLALEAADLGTWDNDLVSGHIAWDARCRAIFGAASDPGDLDEAIAFIHPEDRAAALQAFEAALAGDGNYDIEKRIVRPDGTIRWISAKGRVFFDTGAERRPVRTLGVVADVTERRHAEERQQFLLAELNHRIGNLLATVRSVAASTVRSSVGLADFERAFAGRLDALGRTYTLLAAAEWRSTRLRALVEEALAPYRAADAGNVILRGDDLRLPATMALPLSLVLHELATNAAKYGALSVPEGRVEIDWHAQATPTGRHLVLGWLERDGPAVQAPSRSGFGRSLIERSVAYELGGETQLAFAPAGVCCRIEAPLAAER